MSIRILAVDNVRRALSMSQCIDAMEVAMRATSEGCVLLPGRQIFGLPAGRGSFGLMPGACADPESYGCKVLSIYPHNPDQGRPAIQGAILMFDPATGAPAALLDAASVTAIRTAAVSGLATRLLARKDASVATVFGTGVQAVSHLEAMSALRWFKRFVVWGRNEQKGRQLCEQQSELLGIKVEFQPDAETAALEADVICTVTGASEPVLSSRWVRPGTHINLVGSHDRLHRECDRELITSSRVYVDQREAALNGAGEIMEAIECGAITAGDLVAELGEVAANPSLGRTRPEDITLFKSVGVSSQDMVAADLIWRNSVAHNLGQECAF